MIRVCFYLLKFIKMSTNNLKLPLFGIRNFKSFKGEHWFNLKDITFLIGKNSSGKSSLIQALRISNTDSKSVSNEPDLGIKVNWLNKYVKDQTVEFSKKISIDTQLMDNRFYYFKSYLDEISTPKIEGNFFGNYIKKEEDFDYDEHNAENFHPTNGFLYDNQTNQYLNESDLSDLYLEFKEVYVARKKAVDNFIHYKINSSAERKKWISERDRLIVVYEKNKEFSSFINDFFIDYINFIVSNYDDEILNDCTVIFNQMVKNNCEKNTLITIIPFLNLCDEIQLEPLLELIGNIRCFDDYLTDSQLQIQYYFENLEYPKIRYKKESIFDFDYISNKNEQTNLSALIQSQKNQLQEIGLNKRLDFINRYLEYFEIGERLFFEQTFVGGKAIDELFIQKNGEKKELFTHHGYGVQILIPLLIKVVFSKSDILLIEEPESNLHPALQSRLADFFADVMNSFKKQLVIETHSEYVIRRMQYLIAKNNFSVENKLPKINREQANIYYFKDPENQLKDEGEYTFEINFRKNGSLTKSFDSGFFDVTDDIAYELFMLKNSNLN